MCTAIGRGAGQRAWETLKGAQDNVAPYVVSLDGAMSAPTHAVVDAEAVEETQRPRQEGRHVNPCIITGSVGATRGTHMSTDVCDLLAWRMAHCVCVRARMRPVYCITCLFVSVPASDDVRAGMSVLVRST